MGWGGGGLFRAGEAEITEPGCEAYCLTCILSAALWPSPLSPVLGLLPGRWQARKTSMEQPPVTESQSRLRTAFMLSRVNP